MNPNVIKLVRALGRFVVIYAIDMMALNIVNKAFYNKGLKDGIKSYNKNKKG